MLDVVQVAHGPKITLDRARNAKLTRFGLDTLADRYQLPGEDPQDMFARVAMAYADDTAHAQRLYDYISNLWFMPSTPVLSNGGTDRGLPISCFLNEVRDSMGGIVDVWNENVWLASKGGGIGTYWGNVRSIGESVGGVGKTSGIIPFIKVMDSQTLAISQGSLRRGSAAVYIPISHPEIEEFIDLRRPTGGDPNRRSLNLHHGIVIPDAFMRAVERDEDWALTSPASGAIVRKTSARNLWIKLLTTRIETGEPYLLFIDHINRAIPEHHKLAGLTVKTSNLCSEITLPTGKDRFGKDRTAVCCLSSLNLETYLEWQDHPTFVEDVMRFLDNVLQQFIEAAGESSKGGHDKAIYGAMRERSVGLGVMGFHGFLMGQGVPIESVMSKVWNTKMFSQIKRQADAASAKLAEERGACPDAADYGIKERFSNKISVAPTASISIICGGATPSIEPLNANSYTHKTLSGSFPVRNRYLEKCLETYGKNDEETWRQITLSEGSVQALDFMSADDKLIFKTAFELDQRWLVELAADRTPYICQAQSFNVFLPATVNKKDLHEIHFMAWKRGIKSMYYCRSRSVARAESGFTNDIVKGAGERAIAAAASEPYLPMDTLGGAEEKDYDECLSCQ